MKVSAVLVVPKASFLDLWIATVIIHLSCYNKIPQSKQLINNRMLLLTVPEFGNSKIKVPAYSRVRVLFEVVDC